MEKLRPTERPSPERTPAREESLETDILGRSEAVAQKERAATVRQVIESQAREKAKKSFWRKWAGSGLIMVGATTLLGSCPLYAFSLIGPQTVIVAIALIAAGSALLVWRPRLKDTNEAMIVAMRYGNYLTVPRLALELDISFDHAEKIIRELVQKGIAEIDLDHKDPDNVIAYRIRGL
jgi:hypothetical protein